LKDIQSAVVYEKDEFDYYTDETGEHLKHRRAWGDRGARKLVFAIARTKDGGTYVEVMDAGQVDSVRKQGYNSSDSPWNGPFQDEMWRKSVIRRMAKRLPSSTDIESFGQDLDDDDHAEPEAAPAPATTSSKLAEAVKAAPAPEPAPVKTPEPAPATPSVFSVIGALEGFKDKEYTQEDGTVIKRFVCLLKGASYGTCNAGFGEILKTCMEFKTEVHIKYKQIPRTDGKFINEIVDVGGENIKDDRPI
jgi:hypothetical protein